MRNISALLLTVLVLFSTFSFAIEKHLCGGEIADTSILGNLERCVMPQNDHENGEETLQGLSCCQDLVIIVEGTNKEAKVFKDVDLEVVEFAVLLMYTYINVFEGLEENFVPFKTYVPPLVVYDIPVLYDTFLI